MSDQWLIVSTIFSMDSFDFPSLLFSASILIFCLKITFSSSNHKTLFSILFKILDHKLKIFGFILVV